MASKLPNNDRPVAAKSGDGNSTGHHREREDDDIHGGEEGGINFGESPERGVDPDLVAAVENMGFSRAEAEEGVRRGGGTVTGSVEWILAGGEKRGDDFEGLDRKMSAGAEEGVEEPRKVLGERRGEDAIGSTEVLVRGGTPQGKHRFSSGNAATIPEPKSATDFIRVARTSGGNNTSSASMDLDHAFSPNVGVCSAHEAKAQNYGIPTLNLKAVTAEIPPLHPTKVQSKPLPEVVPAQDPPLGVQMHHDPYLSSGPVPTLDRLPPHASPPLLHQQQQQSARVGALHEDAAEPRATFPPPPSGGAGVRNEDATAEAGVAMVSARLVTDDEYGGDEPDVPLAMATRQGAVSIDLKDRRVRACLAATVVVLVGAVAAGVIVGTGGRGADSATAAGASGEAVDKPDVPVVSLPEATAAPSVAGWPSSPPSTSLWPSVFPSSGPSNDPTTTPSAVPTAAPTELPTASPTAAPSMSPTLLDWLPVGTALYGDDFSRLGWSVSLSSNGTRLAVAAPSDPIILETLVAIGATDSTSGSVKVCSLVEMNAFGRGDQDWECDEVPPPGDPGAGGVLATLVSLSGDGTMLAVGYPRTSNSTRGFVQAYRYEPSRRTGRWVELGPPLFGKMSDARWGGTYQWYDDDEVVYSYDRDQIAQPVTSLSLSLDGSTMAIGSPKDAAGGLPEVRVYRYNGGASAIWEPLGESLTGVNENDFFGQSISLSADGNTVAIGAPRYQNDQHPDGIWDDDDGYFRESGIAAVYRYDDGGDGEWVKMGQNLEGISLKEHPADTVWAFFGDSVSLSDNGTVVAAAAPYRSSDDECEGLVKVHIYSDKNDEWTQHGQMLWQNGGLGDATDCSSITATDGNDSGFAVSLSSDASRLAVGISSSDRYSPFAGEIYVFDFDGVSWIQRGSIVAGRAEGVRAGWSVSLSGDGSHLAIGSPLDKEGGSNAEGRVQVYELGGIVGTPAPSINPCLPREMEVEFFISTDVFGDETRWRILDRDFSAVAMGGPYGWGFIQTDSSRTCLPVDCYKFSLIDHDGISGRGDYSLFVNSQEISTSNGEFEGREDIIIGDCPDAKDAFPVFCADVEEPERVGDGICEKLFNTEKCGYDGGDCTNFNHMYPDCKVEFPDRVGDGECDVWSYNTEECGFDGSDCSDFNQA